MNQLMGKYINQSADKAVNKTTKNQATDQSIN
jgi:hypothetical protein